MTTRRAKQLIYGALYILVLLVVIAIIYLIFIRPFTSGPVTAVCNQSTCAPTSTAPITASALSTFVTSPDHYTFLIQAVNTDPDFGAPELNYEINLYDASNTLIESLPEQTFIYQSQNKYFAVPNIVTAEPVDHATVTITSAAWLASSTLGVVPQLVIQNTQASANSSTVDVSGQLINPNIGSFEKAIVMVIFNDTNNNPIGVSQTEIDNLQPGSTNNFTVMYPVEPNINPALNQVIVYAIR